ncbi:hypothetical protein AQJ91_28665 [Streptomyces dysideae]|uniref:Uncharacterized protein n=1 Tax=Streptomyces dysideae TaxID=909626 RepID=A0A101UVM7_9ACTN|nr:hypothetical protein AQJ91_28665 [Streptomyces dysideae]
MKLLLPARPSVYAKGTFTQAGRAPATPSHGSVLRPHPYRFPPPHTATEGSGRPVKRAGQPLPRGLSAAAT